MKNILGSSIILFSIIAWNSSCVSTNTVAKTSNSQNMREITLQEKNKNNDNMEKNIEIKLSSKETNCVKSQSCRVFLDIQNISDKDIEVGGLEFVLKTDSTDLRTNNSNYINSPVKIDTLENLQPNQASRLIIKGKQHFEKEIDIEKIKWLKSTQSSWKYGDLWDRITEGKYQMHVELGLYTDSTGSLQKEEKIGNVQVKLKNSYKAVSNRLTLNFEAEK